MLSVKTSELTESTKNAITVAVLGNSLTVAQGTIAIAIGSPLGTNYSILTGNITSTTNSISTIDHNYSVFTTDIVGSSNGSGALVNVDGEIIGIVMQGYSSAGDENTLTAISISELKALIEMLSNGQDIPYIGLEVTTVTAAIEREYEIPKAPISKMSAWIHRQWRRDFRMGMSLRRLTGMRFLRQKIMRKNCFR